MQYFLELMHKQLNGNISTQEEQLLISYYSLFDTEPDVLALLSNEEAVKIKKQIKECIWDAIKTQNRGNVAKNSWWD